MKIVCGFHPIVLIFAKVMPLEFHVAFAQSFGWLNDTPAATHQISTKLLHTSGRNTSMPTNLHHLADSSFSRYCRLQQKEPSTSINIFRKYPFAENGAPYNSISKLYVSTALIVRRYVEPVFTTERHSQEQLSVRIQNCSQNLFPMLHLTSDGGASLFIRAA